jgi:polysaccharide export outer membrane protein
MRAGTSTRAVAAATLAVLASAGGMVLAGCARAPTVSSTRLPEPAPYEYKYIVGPGDTLNIFVWRNPELSQSVEVRPDGRFSTPLVDDLLAGGKTPTEIAQEVEHDLSRYVKNPLVTVMVSNFHGVYTTQVRIVGEATTPQALPYRANMSLLDAMIAVGGLTEFAAGNQAKIVRTVNGKQEEMNVRIEDLLQNADMTANVKLAPGDIVLIPEAWF